MFLTCIHLDRKKRKFIKKIYITYIFLIFLHILQKIVVKELLQNGEIVFLISHFLANLTSKKLQTHFSSSKSILSFIIKSFTYVIPSNYKYYRLIIMEIAQL